MKKLLILISIFLFSCNVETLTVPKEKHTEPKSEYPKFVYFDKTESNNSNYFKIWLGSDGHEYQSHKESHVSHQWIHYIDCKLCKQRRDSL